MLLYILIASISCDPSKASFGYLRIVGALDPSKNDSPFLAISVAILKAALESIPDLRFTL
jgi:hypothetical protein